MKTPRYAREIEVQANQLVLPIESLTQEGQSYFLSLNMNGHPCGLIQVREGELQLKINSEVYDLYEGRDLLSVRYGNITLRFQRQAGELQVFADQGDLQVLMMQDRLAPEPSRPDLKPRGTHLIPAQAFTEGQSLYLVQGPTNLESTPRGLGQIYCISLEGRSVFFLLGPSICRILEEGDHFTLGDPLYPFEVTVEGGQLKLNIVGWSFAQFQRINPLTLSLAETALGVQRILQINFSELSLRIFETLGIQEGLARISTQIRHLLPPPSTELPLEEKV